MSEKTTEHINTLFRKEEWKKARGIIRAELKNTPDSHWLWTRLATTYYEEHQYSKALSLEKRALQLAPNCPLVLWDLAGTMDMLGRRQEAIRIWKSIIKRGVNRLAYGECGEGIRWSKSLVNDCRYRIGAAYQELGKTGYAVRYLRDHIANRQPGIPSIYDLREVRKEIIALSAKRE